MNLYPESKIPHNRGKFIPSMDYYESNGEICIVICPGGAYAKRAEHEGKDVALWLNSIGIHAFVLNYRIKPSMHPEQISDAVRAVRLARSKSGDYGYNPNKIGIMGFSAGGHLAASLAVHYNKKFYDEIDDVDLIDCRPDFAILGYPVVDMGEFTHSLTQKILLGNHPKEDMIEFMSIQKNVHDNTPPTFIWHTADDNAVPVENSLMLASALGKHNVPYELHVYPSGRHGLGLAFEENPHAAQWTVACRNWLGQIFN